MSDCYWSRNQGIKFAGKTREFARKLSTFCVLRFVSFELKEQKESQEMAKWKFSKRWWEQIKRAIFLVMLFKEMEL